LQGKSAPDRAGTLKVGLAEEKLSPGVLQVCSILVASGAPQKWRLMRKGREVAKIKALLLRG